MISTFQTGFIKSPPRGYDHFSYDFKTKHLIMLFHYFYPTRFSSTEKFTHCHHLSQHSWKFSSEHLSQSCRPFLLVKNQQHYLFDIWMNNNYNSISTDTILFLISTLKVSWILECLLGTIRHLSFQQKFIKLFEYYLIFSLGFNGLIWRLT